jgi:CheY-like chemotaxis protein
MNPLVLIVDDNETNSYLLAFFCGRLGLRTRTVSSGTLAIEAATAERPDLVLLDLHMPVMDGYETAALLRALPGLESVPIVAVTANISAATRGRIERAGFAGCIVKPIDTDALPAELQRHIPLPPPP